VKGGDYTRDQVVGHEVVETMAAKCCWSYLEGFSTTSLVKRGVRARRERRDGRRWQPGAAGLAQSGGLGNGGRHLRDFDALAPPWSTSLVAIFVLCWSRRRHGLSTTGFYFQSLKPDMLCRLRFFLLAAVARCVSDASWAHALRVGPAAKLLVPAGVVLSFRAIARGMWVFVAFLGLLHVADDCVVGRRLRSLAHGWKPQAIYRGIFVKNYIDQARNFALCAVT